MEPFNPFIPNPYWTPQSQVMTPMIPANLLPFLNKVRKINGKKVINPTPLQTMPAPILGVRG